MTDYLVQVVLPEGVGNIQLVTPYDVERKADENIATYLDTFGRTVLVAEKTNLVEAHIQDIKISYTFSKLLLLQVAKSPRQFMDLIMHSS